MTDPGSVAADRGLDARAALLADRCIGENLDQLATIDMRGDGMGRLLFRAARALSEEPLSLAAARAFRSKLRRGDRVLLLTGLLGPWPLPETDGLSGSAILALALERATGVLPVFACEAEVRPPLMAALRGAGLNVCQDLEQASLLPHAALVMDFPLEREMAERTATDLAARLRPAACIAVERPGANLQGQYHLALGQNVSELIAPVDVLYRRLADQGVLTAAIGDFGNELGMGAIGEVVRAETPAGADCGCGCGGGTACMTPADLTVVASTSDWGAYAVAACLAHLERNPSVLIGADAYRRVLEDAVRAGAVDGPTRYAEPRIDGVDAGYSSRLLELMREAVLYPDKPSADGAIRRYRARRSVALP